MVGDVALEVLFRVRRVRALPTLQLSAIGGFLLNGGMLSHVLLQGLVEHGGEIAEGADVLGHNLAGPSAMRNTVPVEISLSLCGEGALDTVELSVAFSGRWSS